MSKEQAQPVKSHNHAKLAAEIGLVGLGAAGVAGTAYGIWHKQRKAARMFEHAPEFLPYKENAQIFTEERLKPQQRDLLARTATRICMATLESEEGVMTRETLAGLLGAKRHSLQHALGHLRDHKLIDRRPKLSEPKRQGYYATEALIWAVEDGDYPPLEQAVYEMLNGQISDNL